MRTYQPHLSSMGRISANLVAAACFLASVLFGYYGVIVVAIAFIIEKNSRLVRFYAAQGVFLGTVFWLLFRGIKWTWFILLVLCIKGTISAYRWQEWELPFFGKIAQNIVEGSGRVHYNGDGQAPDFCRHTSMEEEIYYPSQANIPPELPQAPPPHSPTATNAYPQNGHGAKPTNYNDPNLQLPECMRDEPPEML